MTPRERLLTALNHREPGRVPFDLGATIVTSITREAYVRLRRYLGFPEEQVRTFDHVQQLPFLDEALLLRLGTDARMVQIEIGVDILNPVQVSARGMDTAALKRDFGRAITFWGGGCDTQYVLPRGTPREVREETRRRINDLAPGGGFVFAAVHNIQAEVPPENVMAMVETLHSEGLYR